MDERRKVIVEHQQAVYSVVGRVLCGAPDLVDDAAQETFVKVLRNLDSFDKSGPASLRTWIVTIATRTAIDALRRVGRDRVRLATVSAQPEAAVDTLENAVDRQRLGERVSEAMAALPADQRAVLVLRAYHDLDYAEIAEAVGISRQAVKSKLNRARAALRSVMSHDG